jgi:hypothetical protein
MYFPLSAITIGQVNMNIYPSVDECISVYINMYSSVYTCLLSAYDVCMYVRSYLYIYIYAYMCIYRIFSIKCYYNWTGAYGYIHIYINIFTY